MVDKVQATGRGVGREWVGGCVDTGVHHAPDDVLAGQRIAVLQELQRRGCGHVIDRVAVARLVGCGLHEVDDLMAGLPVHLESTGGWRLLSEPEKAARERAADLSRK